MMEHRIRVVPAPSQPDPVKMIEDAECIRDGLRYLLERPTLSLDQRRRTHEALDQVEATLRELMSEMN